MAADSIVSEYGSSAAYRTGLLLQTIDTPSDSQLPAFYDLYEQVWPAQLDRVAQHVAAEHRLLLARAQQDRHVIQAVA